MPVMECPVMPIPMGEEDLDMAGDLEEVLVEVSAGDFVVEDGLVEVGVMVRPIGDGDGMRILMTNHIIFLNRLLMKLKN